MNDYEARQMKEVAYVIGMAVGCTCELESMKQANRNRESKGEFPAYDEEAFHKLMLDWGMHHNALVSNLRVEGNP